MRRTTLSLALVVLMGTAGAQAIATTTYHTVTVPSELSVLPGLHLAQRIGETAPGAEVTIGVALAHPYPELEEATYRALYDPTSDAYQHWLTPQQYAQRFGVASTAVRGTESWLRRAGLSIDSVSGPGDYLVATGTAAQVGRLVHVRFGDYSVGRIHFRANENAPTFPTALPISALLGLNTLDRAWTQGQARALNGGAPREATATESIADFTGANLRGVYDVPMENKGEGQRAGVFMNGNVDTVFANLRVFEDHFKLPHVPIRSVRATKDTDGYYGDDSYGWEWQLDAQTIQSMAPNLSEIDLYTAHDNYSASIVAEFSKWQSDPLGPEQMNASFGQCEAGPANPVLGPLSSPPFYFGTFLGDDMQAAAEPILRAATMEGRTLFAANGDSGGACPTVILPIVGAGNGLVIQPVPIQYYPAISPYVTAVGGTILTTAGDPPKPNAPAKRAREIGWTFGGGGPALFIERPDYQREVAAISQPCLIDMQGNPYPTGTVCRGEADIAAFAGDMIVDPQQVGGEEAFQVYADMAYFPGSGTSVSSPLAVGMWSTIQAASSNRGGLGFANESFYRAGTGPHAARDFTDITTSELPLGNGFNRAGKGWDYMTGFGVLDVAHLMKDLTGRTTPITHVMPNAAPANITGCATMTSPAGDATNVIYMGTTDPNHDMTSASLTVSGSDLIATIAAPHVEDLVLKLGEPGAYFDLMWATGSKTYYVRAKFSSERTWSFSDGTIGDFNSHEAINKDVAGSYKDGVIRMVVPFKDVGSPKAGTELRYPYAAAVNPAVLDAIEDVAVAGQPGQIVKIGAPCHRR